MKLNNTIIHLIGHSGVGKYTIAREIAALCEAKIVDNHLVNNPIFAVLDPDEPEYPSGIWHEIDKVREAVFNTIRNHSPADYSFIFTHALKNGGEKYQRILDLVIDLAKSRQAVYVPVRLHCSVEENLNRIVQPQRKERLKPTDPTRMLKHRSALELIDIPHKNLLDIEISDLSAKEAAAQILAHAVKAD